MNLIEYLNSRIKLCSIFDIKLAQGAAIFLALVIVKLFPRILEIDIWWFIVLTIIFAIKPLYVVFLKK